MNAATSLSAALGALGALGLAGGSVAAGGLLAVLAFALVTLALAALLRYGLPPLLEFARADPESATVKRIRLALLGIFVLIAPAVFMAETGVGAAWLARPVFALLLFLVLFSLGELGLLALGGLLARGGTRFPSLFRDILRIALYVLAFMFILRTVFNVGDLGALLGASAVFSIIVGLAVQDTLGSVFAGLFLEIDRPFRVGDWVNVNGREGRVSEINWRSTRLITRTNDAISIPNSAMSKGDIINFSAPSTLHRVEKRVAVSYAVQPNKVKKIILESIGGIKGALATPTPQVYLDSYGDAMEYVLSFWVKDFSQVYRVAEEVMTAIWYQFRRHGVPFAKDGLFKAHAERQRAEAESLHQALRRVDFLAPATDQDLVQLAADTTHNIYAAGERIFAQGEAGGTFYVISSGSVEVRIRDGGGRDVKVADLGRGEYFGEQSLLTGSPRSATVVAREDSDLLELDRRSFSLLLQNSPAIGAAMKEIVERRQEATQAKVAGAQAQATSPAEGGTVREEVRSVSRRLLRGLGTLFGLRGGGGPRADAAAEGEGEEEEVAVLGGRRR